jgi:hypothetical protein
MPERESIAWSRARWVPVWSTPKLENAIVGTPWSGKSSTT